MTTIIPIARRGDDLRLGLDLLSETLRDGEFTGVTIPGVECATIASLIERVTVRLMFLEGIEQAAVGRANAQRALLALEGVEAEPDDGLVDRVVLEAAIASGKVATFRPRAGAPS